MFVLRGQLNNCNNCYKTYKRLFKHSNGQDLLKRKVCHLFCTLSSRRAPCTSKSLLFFFLFFLAQREWGNRPTCQRFPDGSCGNPGRQTPHAALRLPPMCVRYDDVPGERIQIFIYNTDNVYNMHKVEKHKIVYSPSSAPIYSIQFPCTALHRRQQFWIRFRCSKSDLEPMLCRCCPSRPQRWPLHPLPGTAWHHKGPETPPYSRNES